MSDTRGHSMFSGTKAMGRVMGSALAKCGSKPQASKLIKSSLFASVSCGGAGGIARTLEGGGGDSG